MRAQALAVAVDLLAAVRTIRRPSGAPVQLRLGLHCGPLMTGVVGTAAPRFCCFGVSLAEAVASCGGPFAPPGHRHMTRGFHCLRQDTVSTASRMSEGTGAARRSPASLLLHARLRRTR